MIKVQIGDRWVETAAGTTAGEVINQEDADDRPLAAIVDHRVVDLGFPLTSDAKVRPVTYRSRQGVLVYRKTASLVLLEAVRLELGDVRVSIGQSLGNGYAYHFEEGLSKAQCESIEARMRELIAEDIPIRKSRVMISEARRLFETRGEIDKLQLLKTWRFSHVDLLHCGGTCDVAHYAVAPSAGYLSCFELAFEPPGLLLRFPPRHSPDKIEPLQDSPKLKQVYSEGRHWIELLGVKTIGQLNQVTMNGGAGELIRVAEGLHEKRIAQIADMVCSQDRSVRVVLVAGPSSSGKTTFSKRLSLQLRVNGIEPVALSTDNFYVNREDTPLDENGKYDFESIEAIDLELFNDVLARLLRGEEVKTPRFDFTAGERRPPDKWNTMCLKKGQVLVVEGIHGLNPRLTESIPEEQKFRIYINALTQLYIDNHNRIFTSDTRFLRRLVRDRRFRGYSAAQTIANWPSVRQGELKWIFPYQELANAMFNSALVYEHGVMRLYAERFLLEVPEDHPSFVDALRLYRYLQNVVPIFDESIPQTSLMCEFIGGSYFSY